MAFVENYQMAESIQDFFTAKSMIYYVFVFLAIYLVCYFLLSLFFNTADPNNTLRLVRIVDVTIFVFLVVFLVISYGNKSTAELSSQLSKNIQDFKEFSDDEYSIVTVLVFILVFYMCIYVIRIPMSAELKPVSILIIENIALILFVILLILNFFKYLLEIDLFRYSTEDIVKVLNETAAAPESTRKPFIGPSTSYNGGGPQSTPAVPNPTIEVASADEVFNIRNNLYTYDEAQAVCSIYGAKLATYEQVEDAYNNGGEWCNYGWSQDQMALFPTQKSTWKTLQTRDSMKNSCGRPGINGGYMKNKNIKFGVNCFGKKPTASAQEKAMMEANSGILPSIPLTPADKMLQTKMKIWKNNADEFLVVNSFNRQEWSDVK